MEEQHIYRLSVCADFFETFLVVLANTDGAVDARDEDVSLAIGDEEAETWVDVAVTMFKVDCWPAGDVFIVAGWEGTPLLDLAAI